MDSKLSIAPDFDSQNRDLLRRRQFERWLRSLDSRLHPQDSEVLKVEIGDFRIDFSD